MADYRITITGAEATDQDQVKLHCLIEKENDVGGWETLAAGPSSLRFRTSDLLGVLRLDAVDAAKRAALLEMVRSAARGLPVIQADVAIDRLEALLPSGWPVTVGL